MDYVVYFSDNGVGKTGLSPVWLSLRALDGTDKNDSNAPVITEISGSVGFYKFSVTPGAAPLDVDKLVGVIDSDDASMGAYDRYKPAVISTDDDDIQVLHDMLGDVDSTGTEVVSAAKALELVVAAIGGKTTVSTVDVDTKRVQFKGRDGTTTILQVDTSSTTSGSREASLIS